MNTEGYLLVLNRPDGVTVERMKAYIKRSVECWNGQFEPDDPLFGWFFQHGNAVKVKRLIEGEMVCISKNT